MKLIKILIPAFVCLLSLLVLLSGTQTAFAYETIKVDIPVDCLEVYGNNTHTYELKIESENESSPVPVSDILTIAEDSTGTFEIYLTEPGTYRYSIYEVTGNDTNIQYDSSRYNITVYTENNEDVGLSYTITACRSGADSKAESIAFQDIILSDTATTTAETTTHTYTTIVTTVTTSVTTMEHKTDIVNSILTGDSFPTHAIRLVMLISAMTAIFAFLFKQKKSEEEEKNE